MARLRSYFFERPLLGFLLLCAVVKGALVLSLADVFFYGEELEKGTAAKAMLDSLPVPHHQLAYHYYEGGGFVVSHLKALAFLAVGENVLAHKLVALVFVLGVLAAGWGFVKASFGTRAASWFALLFIFAPESFQKLSLINLGIHIEASVFLFGTLWLGARLAFGEQRRRREWLLLGLVTGFGLYFSYQLGLAAAWVALVLAVRRPREVFGVGGLLGVLGTVLGALPLIWMYGLVGDAIFDIHGEAIAGEEAGPSKLQLLSEFGRSVFVDADFGSRLTATAWVVATVLTPLVLLRRGRESTRGREAALYVFGYCALFALVYLGSGFTQGRVFHFFVLLRLAPAWIFATVLVAAALANLQARGDKRAQLVSAVAGTLLLALGLRATWSALHTGSPSTPRVNWHVLTHAKGYSYDQYFAKVLWHMDGDARAKLELLEAFDEPARPWLRAEAVGNLYRATGLGTEASLAAVFTEIESLPPERLEDYVFGLGPLVVISSGWNPGPQIAQWDAQPAAMTDLLIEAVARFGLGGYPLRENVDREVAWSANLQRPELYWRGLGRWIYSRFRLHEAHAIDFIAPYDEPVRAALLDGYRAEREWHTLSDRLP